MGKDRIDSILDIWFHFIVIWIENFRFFDALSLKERILDKFGRFHPERISCFLLGQGFWFFETDIDWFYRAVLFISTGVYNLAFTSFWLIVWLNIFLFKHFASGNTISFSIENGWIFVNCFHCFHNTKASRYLKLICRWSSVTEAIPVLWISIGILSVQIVRIFIIGFETAHSIWSIYTDWFFDMVILASQSVTGERTVGPASDVSESLGLMIWAELNINYFYLLSERN